MQDWLQAVQSVQLKPFVDDAKEQSQNYGLRRYTDYRVTMQGVQSGQAFDFQCRRRFSDFEYLR